MAIGYAEGSIAGVSLQNAGGTKFKCLLLDMGNFRPTLAGNTEFAADSTPWTQVQAVAGGRAFGALLEYADPGVVTNIIAAINAAVLAGNSFNVTLADDLNSINENCIPDFATGWLKIVAQRTHTDVVKGIEFRFLTEE
jgi:hypothetical protein